MPLGVRNIPLDRIVGTELPGRTAAFAGNFMPLMDDRTEFYAKWRSLFESVMEEGLKDPPRVLEYMHRYYAIEGNKRISVMKLLDSGMMEAEVTRVYPARSEEKEVRVYYEFLDFYNDSRVGDVDCTEPGSYRTLIELSGHTPGERWPQEDTEAFAASYSLFLSACRRLNEQTAHVTAGDILLLYIQAFGYEQYIKDTSTSVTKNLERLRSEVQAQNDETITLKLSTDGQEPGLLHRLFRSSAAPVKVCFINHRSPEQSGWTYWHALGRNHVDEAFKGQVTTEMINDVAPSECEEVIMSAAKNGARVIFTTSPAMVDGALRAAIELPEVKVLNCSLRPMFKTVRSYYLRMYEAKFILGAIAGACADDNRIGYIADYPVFGLPASVNAFALGARMTNPRAKVYLDWANLKDHDPEQALTEQGVTVISNRDIAAPAFESQGFGLYREKDGVRTRLAMPVWDWGKMYEAILRRIANGQWDTDTQGGAQVLNYWWGMDSGAIDVFYSAKLDPGTRRIINLLHDSVKSGALLPFAGEIRDQAGTLRCGEEDSLNPAQLMTMNWLCDNVVGSFPTLDMLTPRAVDFVRRQGVLEAAPPDLSEIRIEQRKA